MTGHPFPYQYLKITQAQLQLMSRNTFQAAGEVRSVALALELCTDALKDWDLTLIKDDDACRWIETIKRVIDTTNVQDDGKGVFYNRARVMTLEERDDLSDALIFLLVWLDKVF